jgi:hypothetical protein
MHRGLKGKHNVFVIVNPDKPWVWLGLSEKTNST